MDALNDQDIGELTSGFNINLNELGSTLNVRAEVNGTIGSILFSLDSDARQQAQIVLKSGDVGALRILTMKGQVIRKQPLQVSHTDIDLTGLVPGTYLVEVRQEGVVGRQLLVVQ